MGISFKVYDTSICVINCHLSPFKENVDERNEQFHRIVEKLKFQDEALKSIYEYDVAMWLGDLNYRIADLTDQRIDELVAKQLFELLNQCDQLKLAKETGKAFDDFVECPIYFPPTYKFVIGGQEYNVGQG